LNWKITRVVVAIKLQELEGLERMLFGVPGNSTGEELFAVFLVMNRLVDPPCIKQLFRLKHQGIFCYKQFLRLSILIET
jgi:hypothetical protein